ncbi:MAG: hypothetical protein Ct9H90mP26_1600 [Methanobacteriota archaeon]|nr:MAG: hypothetical protein Ct9H90mP26_1600 [Euryarchaeota archaeon]
MNDENLKKNNRDRKRIWFLKVTFMYDGSNVHRMNQTQKNTLHRAIIGAFARFEQKWTPVN